MNHAGRWTGLSLEKSCFTYRETMISFLTTTNGDAGFGTLSIPSRLLTPMRMFFAASLRRQRSCLTRLAQCEVPFVRGTPKVKGCDDSVSPVQEVREVLCDVRT